MVSGSKTRWYGIVIPLLAALSTTLFARLEAQVSLPHPLVAVLSGVIVAFVSFLVFNLPLFRESMALAKAALLGTLVAEVMMFHATTDLPSMTTVTLFLFLYLNSTQHATADD